MDENRILIKEELYALLYEFDDHIEMMINKVNTYLESIHMPNDRVEIDHLLLYLHHLRKLRHYYHIYDVRKK